MKLLRVFVIFSVCCYTYLEASTKHIVLIAGKPSHGPGEHEHRAGCLLFQKCLASVPGIDVRVYDQGWPQIEVNGVVTDNDQALSDADAIIIYSDGGVSHPMLQGHRLSVLDKLHKQGVGLGFIHYAVEPTRELGQSEMLSWIGGAFEVNWSVNPVWKANYIQLPVHEVTRGVHPFSQLDEWYFNMRFRNNMEGVTPLLSAVPPVSTMKRKDGLHEGNPSVRKQVQNGLPQHMMWVSESQNGARGFGFTGGHYHKGWANDDKRKLVLNAIVWIAKVPVPEQGIESHLSSIDLETNLDAKVKKVTK